MTMTPRILSLALLLTACTHVTDRGGGETDSPSSRVRPQDPAPHEGAKTPSASRHSAYSDANNAFGFDLWRTVRKGDNLSIAPASISLALGMTWTGARGTTAEQMGRAMHLGGDVPSMATAMGEQLRAWNEHGDDYELRVVDRLFGEKTAKFDADFLALMQRSYGAPLEPVDFIHGYEQARVHINDWVEDSTKDRIRDLLPEDSLSELTRLVLTNAVYFKGDWQHAFDANDTYDGTFHVRGNEASSRKLMHQFGTFGYAKKDGVQIVELPYKGGDLALDIVLPERKDGIDEIARTIDDTRFAELVGALQPTGVQLTLPKFKLEMSGSLPLKDPLKKLGMELAFTTGADFSGMSTAIHPLFIDDVYHKTFVAVDEEGTEAAAATAVVMRTESAMVIPDGTPFVADHPFMFVLRDVKSGTIMFLGQVVDPK